MLPWYSGIPLAMAEFFGMHHVRLNPLCLSNLCLITPLDNLPRPPEPPILL
jgi:hypothetical protein